MQESDLASVPWYSPTTRAADPARRPAIPTSDLHAGRRTVHPRPTPGTCIRTRRCHAMGRLGLFAGWLVSGDYYNRRTDATARPNARMNLAGTLGLQQAGSHICPTSLVDQPWRIWRGGSLGRT